MAIWFVVGMGVSAFGLGVTSLVYQVNVADRSQQFSKNYKRTLKVLRMSFAIIAFACDAIFLYMVLRR